MWEAHIRSTQVLSHRRHYHIRYQHTVRWAHYQILAKYVDIDNNHHIFKKPWVHILFNTEKQKQLNTVQPLQMDICKTIAL